jgi:nucleotide-binding universal stress UspA family protein
MRGDPIERILAFARTYGVSLIAMATHGRRGLDRWLRGSVTEEVIRRSPVPVLAATPAAIASVLSSAAPFSRIMVPLDGSERAARIMPLVAEVAALHRAEVTILHAVDQNHVHLGVPLADILLEAPEMALRQQAAPLQRAKVAYRLMTVFGEGAQTAILDVARREQIGLVALTTHGRQGLSRWIFGSVAEEVLRLCPCPILLQRTPLADEELALELAGATASH